ncbi:MAG: hypothetical protein EOO40_05965, partial [Deltaproteobacteria bacterium]
MPSLLPSATIWQVQSCADRATSCGHAHHGGGCCSGTHPVEARHDKVHYQSTWARKLDPKDLNEKCACCQAGVPDGPDEIAGAMGASHHHRGLLHVPSSPMQLLGAGVMGLMGGVGLYTGHQNRRQARATVAAFRDRRDGKLPQIGRRLDKQKQK